MLSYEKKATDLDSDIESDVMRVNNSFAHLIKEINVARYGNDRQLLPTFSPCEIYQYSDLMLKNLPEKSLEEIEKMMLYSK